MTLEIIIAGIMFFSLVLYILTGGADFGGGVWTLFATGPRAKDQRRILADAIAPIWEANHVWLIIVIVLLFTAFPTAFSLITTALHVPLLFMLLGIVFRGSAFVFQSQFSSSDPQPLWNRIFSVASLLTPAFLGISVGTIASGIIPTQISGLSSWEYFFGLWLKPFPFAIGFFTLALFAFLAAVYVIFETTDDRLREDFRNRALISGVAVGVAAWLSLYIAREQAPMIFKGLFESHWAREFQFITGLIAVAALVFLAVRWYQTARILVIVQAILIVTGWALSQYPYLIYPTINIHDAAAPDSVLRPLLWVLSIGAVLVVPAFGYLYFVFKRKQLTPLKRHP